MTNRRDGTIVNVSFAAGALAVKERAAYGTSKTGVSMLTHVHALGWAVFGITINAAAWPSEPPGPNGFRLLLATVDDVAAAVGYPVSPAARLITGAIVPVDGGVKMR